MANTASITINSDRFQGLVKNVSSRVNAMKTRQLLQATISKFMKELSWVQDRLIVSKGENEAVVKELKAIQESLIEPERQHDALIFEKETVQKSFDAEGISESEIQKQSKQLHTLKQKDNQISEEISILNLTQREYRSQLDLLESQNKHYKDEQAKMGKQISSLLSEITAKERICNLLDKILSKSQDSSSDTQTIVQNYIADTQTEMNNLTKALADAQVEISKIQKVLPTATSEKNRLQIEVNNAIAETGSDYDIGKLETTIQSHKAREKTVIQLNDAMKNDIQKLESEIAVIDQKIREENENESRSARRYEYLLSQKHKMDAISSPEKEILRLQENAKHFQHEIKVSRDILDVSGMVKKELAESCNTMKSNALFYDNELDSLKESLSTILL